MTSVRTDLRLSVQIRGASDRVAGHLATGVLAGEDIVLVPAPPDDLLETSRELELLVIPVPLRRTMLIERFRVRKTIHYAQRPPYPENASIAALKIAGFSRYATQMADLSVSAMAAELDRARGDWWAAMSALRIIPAGIRNIPAGVLRELPRMEEEQNRSCREAVRTDSYADEVGKVCHLKICRCQQ
ncbi:hypothetical protein ABZ921_03535 [Streptomyces atriruber]|uniref:Uncharacterized protein n=1 Tax=Streptomyces atriruber TaxID=545121 RepID=A0ABV3BFA2_9ACTN